MKLTRSGASRNHGQTELINKDVKTPQFDAKTLRIRLRVRDQRDPINRSTYDYALDLSLEEVGSIIDALDRIPAVERTSLMATFGSRTRSLLRLAHVAAGVPVHDSTAA